MFRIWGKIFKDNHLVRDMVYENGDTDINRTKKVFAGIHAFAEAFDLQQPIWLDKNINEFSKDVTTIFIAHRLSTIKNCDKIFVMEKGRIIESGTHQELKVMGGKYAELVSQQSLESTVEENIVLNTGGIYK